MSEIFMMGAAYSLPFVIKSGETVITSADVSSVRIGIANLTAIYPNGRLSYTDGVWYFPITQAQSYRLPQGEVCFQVQIQLASGEVLSSKKDRLTIGGSIFNAPFGQTELRQIGIAQAATVARLIPNPDEITAEIQPFSGSAAIHDAPYTTLERNTYGASLTILTVRLHNLAVDRTYVLRAYTVSRHCGRKYGAWYSPPDYTEVTDEEKKKFLPLGYGMLADRYIQQDSFTWGDQRFAAVPDWMPNNGFLQTKWEIQQGATQIQIALNEWLVPLAKPCVDQRGSGWDGGFVPISGEAGIVSAVLIGIGQKAHAGKLFRFCLTDDTGAIYSCRNTLKVCRRTDAPYVMVETSQELPFIRSKDSLYTSIF